MCKFKYWLKKNVGKIPMTEISASDYLEDLRRQQEGCLDLSFDTICGYAEHGAIIHYGATEETDVEIKPEGLLLVDSGGQYLDGTTDITRTIWVGNPANIPAAVKRDYTLVLKGHIALACARFPKGTRGNQLDVLARQFLWAEGMTYGHGTGHGVGHFLGVHEGPQNIRLNENPTTLKPGMITSNEPGLYKAGKYGIRTENLVLTVPAGHSSRLCRLR